MNAMKLRTREPWSVVSRLPALLTGSGYALTLVAAAYALIALVCRPRTYRRSTNVRLAPAAVPQPVTVLKPLCGNEPRLEENLVTLCEQSYPEYQLVFGVRDPLDPAIAVIERLKTRYPNAGNSAGNRPAAAWQQFQGQQPDQYREQRAPSMASARG